MGKEKDLEREDKDIILEESKVKKEKKPKKTKVNKNTQEYLDQLMKRRKKIFVISIIVIILLFVIAIALTAFSIVASVNNKIISGVTINGVDVSGLTVNEAEEKLNKQIEETKIDELNIEYEDYKNTIIRDDLNINYSVKNAVDKAYKIGRDNNIILNNFKIIGTFFSKEDIRDAFLEFKSYQCEYKNCMHDKEECCKVKQAVEEGKILKSRYENYLKLKEGDL